MNVIGNFGAQASSYWNVNHLNKNHNIQDQMAKQRDRNDHVQKQQNAETVGTVANNGSGLNLVA